MEGVSVAIINLPGLSEQVCLSSPTLYSWESPGSSYTCLSSFHSHRPKEESNPNPKFPFLNCVYLFFFLRLLQKSPFIIPLLSSQPYFSIPNIFSFWLIITNMSHLQFIYSRANIFRDIKNVYRMHLYFLKGLTWWAWGEEAMGHDGYDPCLWEEWLGSNTIPPLTSQERQLTGRLSSWLKATCLVWALLLLLFGCMTFSKLLELSMLNCALLKYGKKMIPTYNIDVRIELD